MTVLSLASFRQRGIVLTVQYKYIFSNPLSFRPCYRLDVIFLLELTVLENNPCTLVIIIAKYLLLEVSIN